MDRPPPLNPEPAFEPTPEPGAGAFEQAAPVAETGTRFPCAQCGAKLVFKPGMDALKCPYCGYVNQIEPDDADTVVEELDFSAAMNDLINASDVEDVSIIKCDACAAEIDAPPNVDSLRCPYCAHNIVTTAISKRLIKPGALLPFKVTRDEARTSFRGWLKKLWFAPNALKKQATIDGRLAGVYVPYWTYDSNTTTDYRGQRGEHYYVPVTYTTTVNGRTQTRTRMERRTRWYPASGTVRVPFDDVLVLASTSISDKHAQDLEPWDLKELVPYKDDYLAGFTTERYEIDLPNGFNKAKVIMDPTIRSAIRRDIGGDEQRISSMRTAYSNITYKHLLLPLWISAYRFQNKVYRFFVNARTGEVKGERPWSIWKIALAVLGALLVIGGIIAIFAVVKGNG